MQAGIAFNAEGQPYFLTFTEAKPPIVVVLLEVKLLGPIKGQRRHLGRQHAVQRQVSLVVIATVAANKIETGPLLNEAQGHDFHLVPLSS